MVDEELRKLRDENKGLKLWLIALLFLLVSGAVTSGVLSSKASGTARDEGYREGYSEALGSGYDDGYAAGRSSAFDELYDSRYNAGYSDAEYKHRGDYEEGFDSAREKYEGSGYQDGYNAGFEEGAAAGNATGYQDGYRCGYDDGSHGNDYNDEP